MGTKTSSGDLEKAKICCLFWKEKDHFTGFQSVA